MPEFVEFDDECPKMPSVCGERVDDVMDHLNYPPMPPRRGYNSSVVEDVVTAESTSTVEKSTKTTTWQHQKEATKSDASRHSMPRIQNGDSNIPNINHNRQTPIRSDEICDEFILHSGKGMILNGHTAETSLVLDDLSPVPSPEPLVGNDRDSKGESFSSDKTLIADELDFEPSQRRDSLDSNSTEALLSEAEREITLNNTNRELDNRRENGQGSLKGEAWTNLLKVPRFADDLIFCV